jgi:chemotaxis protein MotB
VNGDSHRQEIIIIKRGGEGEEGHHGGAWKIAFADFMTAMMALFLVLWLVNAANEETKKAVASYFNPVKLVDRNQSKKGLDEQSGGPSQGEEHGASEVTASAAERPAKAEAPQPQQNATARLFEDPFATLDEIAETELKRQAAAKADQGERTSEINTEGDPFPDPFDPKPAMKAADVHAAMGGEAASPPAPGEKNLAETDHHLEAKAATAAAVSNLIAASGEKTASTGIKPEKSEPAEARRPEAEPLAEGEDMAKNGRKREIEALSKSMLKEIQTEMALAFDDAGPMNAALTVKAVEDGVLISVTDVLNYPMFEIGSAVPHGRIVLAMEKIGQVLAKQSGPLRIYGHTDARQYKAGSGDNWQLSSQRALAAYYMLERAGLSGKRVTQVTGFADRELRSAANPNADENRRIELLLEVK